MKKSILIFAVLILAITATVVYATNFDDNIKNRPIAVIVEITGNDLVIDCAEKVTLTYFSAELGHTVILEKDYDGGDQYGFSLGSSYSGCLCANLVTSCDHEIVGQCMQGVWAAPDIIHLSVSVTTAVN